MDNKLSDEAMITEVASKSSSFADAAIKARDYVLSHLSQGDKPPVLTSEQIIKVTLPHLSIAPDCDGSKVEIANYRKVADAATKEASLWYAARDAKQTTDEELVSAISKEVEIVCAESHLDCPCFPKGICYQYPCTYQLERGLDIFQHIQPILAARRKQDIEITRNNTLIEAGQMCAEKIAQIEQKSLAESVSPEEAREAIAEAVKAERERIFKEIKRRSKRTVGIMDNIEQYSIAVEDWQALRGGK